MRASKQILYNPKLVGGVDGELELRVVAGRGHGIGAVRNARDGIEDARSSASNVLDGDLLRDRVLQNY